MKISSVIRLLLYVIKGDNMEQTSNFIEIISNLGFPIACCVAMFWLYVKEIGSLKEALQNNTLVMQKLLDKLSNE